MIIKYKQLFQYYSVLFVVVCLLPGCGFGDDSYSGEGATPAIPVTEASKSPGYMSEALKEGLVVRDADLPEIIQAVIKRDRKLVAHLIGYGVDLESADSYGQTAIFYAVDRLEFDIVEMLLTHGASVNAKTNGGKTLLMRAVDMNSSEMVSRLLKAGSAINEKNKFGITALHTAVVLKNLNIVKILVRAGADIHAQDKNFDTPLTIANKIGNQQIIDALSKRGQSHCCPTNAEPELATKGDE
jgi:ankyrin repeat protein